MRKRGQIWDTLIPWMVALLVLILSLSVYLILSGKLDSISEFLGNFLRFGR